MERPITLVNFLTFRENLKLIKNILAVILEFKLATKKS